METEIGIVCNRPGDRQSVLYLREAIGKGQQKIAKCVTKARVSEFSPLSKALSWRNELPNGRVVVTVGFRREQIEESKIHFGGSGEPIIVCDPDAANDNLLATASLVNNPPIVPCKDIVRFVKKSLIRSYWRNQVQIRPPESDAEWAGYFSLRYRVWEENNFLTDENRRARTKWEIDWKDRTAIPLCAITSAGKVVGCVRVLKSYGWEEHPFVSQITTCLQAIGDDTLLKLFSFPNAAKFPFDLLMEFRGFGAHYRALIMKNKEPAEISRVAVDPEYRKEHLSEVLVDTAVAHAEARHFSPIFLACSEKLVPLYENCGFVPVNGLKSSKYLNIQLPSTVMERQVH